MQLRTADGTRKYLTASERGAFLQEADLADRPVRTLSITLALIADRVDLAADLLVFESLKKRRTGVFRSMPPCPARYNRHGTRHPRAAREAWQRPRRAALAVVADGRLAGGACSDAGRRGSRVCRPRPKGCGTVSGWPPLPPASRSTWCRNGLATPSSAPRLSMPTPLERRKRTSLDGCGGDGQGEGCPGTCFAL
jgi:integrase/recombinase XerD